MCYFMQVLKSGHKGVTYVLGDSRTRCSDIRSESRQQKEQEDGENVVMRSSKVVHLHHILSSRINDGGSE